MRMVGGTGIIGQDMVCSFGKTTIVFDKWEYGDWHYSTGEAIETTERLRTPEQYRKELKANTTYKLICNKKVSVLIREYNNTGKLIWTTNTQGNSPFIFTTMKVEDYTLLVLLGTDIDTKVTIKEVS